jgi:hypothetical protein
MSLSERFPLEVRDKVWRIGAKHSDHGANALLLLAHESTPVGHS